MRTVSITKSAVLVVMSAFLAAGCGRSGGESLEKGLSLVKNGQYAEAIPLLEGASRNSPDNAALWCNLGLCYWQSGRMDEALKALRKGVDLASGSPEAYEYLGLAYIDAGSFEDARSVLVTANQIDPDNVRIITALGVVEMKTDRNKEAFRCFMGALDRDGEYAPAIYNLAVLYRDKLKNKALAEKFFRRFLAVAPSDPRAPEARAFLDPGSAAVESPAKPLVEKVKRAMSAEDYDAAIAAAREAVEKDPEYAEALWHLAVLTDQVLKDASGALSCYRNFAAKFPEDKRSGQAVSRSSALESDLAIANKIREKSSIVTVDQLRDPVQAARAEDAFEAGCAWQKKNDPRRAMEFYRRAIELNGQMVEAMNNLGLLYLAEKKYDKAEDVFSQAVTVDAGYADAKYMLAFVQHIQGNRPGAMSKLEDVLRSDPDSANAHYLMGVVLAEENQLEASKVHFDLYAELKDGNR